MLKHLILCCSVFVLTSSAQQVIKLPVSGSEQPAKASTEQQYFSKAWNTEIVTNVTEPSLTVFKPRPGAPQTGIGVIVCPGGGFMALSINSEGNDVARWLSGRGVTAFVLKYRLAPSGTDAAAEFQQLWSQDKAKLAEMIKTVAPKGVSDGLAAVAYVKQHAAEFGISPEKVGIVGFSAGGTVAAGAALEYTGRENRPAFVAPIYAALFTLPETVPTDAPPLFVTAATDDNLGLAPQSVRLYERWTAGHHPAELHMFAKGGHGFGMRISGLPSEQWIERFWAWLTIEDVLPQ